MVVPPPCEKFPFNLTFHIPTQAKETTKKKVIEEYKRDQPDLDESAIKVDLPEALAKNALGQPFIAPGGVHNISVVYNGHPMMHHPIPNPNPIVGHHPHLRLVPPSSSHMRHQPQPVANQRQLAPNTRARAAVIEQKVAAAAAANAKAEQARLAQIRLAEAENRIKHRLDKVRDQRAAVRME